MLIITVTATAVDGGAWSRDRSEVFAKVSWIAYDAHQIRTDLQQGLRSPDNPDDALDLEFRSRFESRQAFVYVEYGLHERLTLVLTSVAGELMLSERLATRSTSGLGDVQLGLRYQWLQTPVVAASSLRLKVPGLYDDDDAPIMGTGEFDVDGSVLISRSLGSLYGGGEGGIRLRGGLYSNQLPLAAEIGLVQPRTAAKLYYRHTVTLADAAQLRADGLPFLEGDSRRLGMELSLRLAGALWADAGWEEVFEGENIGAGRAWTVGLHMQ